MMDNKNTTCVIMQPTYLPWVGYFDLIQKADVFVFLNDVQFAKQSWQVKNRIKSQGKELMLTLPVKKSPLSTLIKEVQIDNTKKWKQNHLKSIFYNYNKSDFFNEVYPVLESLLDHNTTTLAELNIAIIKDISHRILGEKNFINSCDLAIKSKDKIDRIIQICKAVDATNYLSPKGSIGYLESMNYEEKFRKAGISFETHEYLPKEYKQMSSPFTPYLSIVDLLFNKGFETAKSLI